MLCIARDAVRGGKAYQARETARSTEPASQRVRGLVLETVGVCFCCGRKCLKIRRERKTRKVRSDGLKALSHTYKFLKFCSIVNGG